MGEQHRLGPLQMGIPRHQRIPVAPAQRDQGLLHLPEAPNGVAAGLQRIKPHVGGYLVVAGTPGVQAPRRRADELMQAAFDVHVQVFQGRVPWKAAAFDLVFDLLQAVNYGVGVLGRNCSGVGQHPGVSNRSGNVMSKQAPVVMDGYGVIRVRRHQTGSSVPQALGGWLLVMIERAAGRGPIPMLIRQ